MTVPTTSLGEIFSRANAAFVDLETYLAGDAAMALTHADLQEYIATHGREVLRTLCSLLPISRHLFPTARTPHNPLRREDSPGRSTCSPGTYQYARGQRVQRFDPHRPVFRSAVHDSADLAYHEPVHAFWRKVYI